MNYIQGLDKAREYLKQYLEKLPPLPEYYNAIAILYHLEKQLSDEIEKEVQTFNKETNDTIYN